MDRIAQSFDGAAAHYDDMAPVQAEVARHLVARAAAGGGTPSSVLDIGCGTGFVSARIAQSWPTASLSALDPAPAMLAAAQAKVPGLHTMVGDATTIDLDGGYDLIVSSMALQWLPSPRRVLERWRRWLGPDGALHVALPVEGSFREWRDLCARIGIGDGLWPMPPGDFAESLSCDVERRTIVADHVSAQDFLHSLKRIGAATPRPGHRPASPQVMRQLLKSASRPFPVTYEILFITIAS